MPETKSTSITFAKWVVLIAAGLLLYAFFSAECTEISDPQSAQIGNSQYTCTGPLEFHQTVTWSEGTDITIVKLVAFVQELLVGGGLLALAFLGLQTAAKASQEE
jgi:hypothetical protein